MIVVISTLKRSAHNSVAVKLRDKILQGRLLPATRLPAERALCEKFRVSRITIRHALRILAEEGLLQRRHGSGTYVKPNPTRRIPLKIDYTGSMREHAPRLRRQVLVCDWKPAAADVAEALAIPTGTQVLYAERVDQQDGAPVAWDQAHIAAEFATGLAGEHLAQVDFVETWMKLAKFAVHSCRQQVEAVAADALTAKRLGIRPGAPVLKSTEVYFAAKDRPAGLVVSYYHSKQICITSWFRWRERAPV